MQLPKVMWSLNTGPNDSHLFDCDWHWRLRDAEDHIRRLPPCPDGKPRPYRLERWEWKKDEFFPGREIASVKVVDSRYNSPKELSGEYQWWASL